MVINPIVGVYIPIIRIPIEGGMTIPNIATFDHGTYVMNSGSPHELGFHGRGLILKKPIPGAEIDKNTSLDGRNHVAPQQKVLSYASNDNNDKTMSFFLVKKSSDMIWNSQLPAVIHVFWLRKRKPMKHPIFATSAKPIIVVRSPFFDIPLQTQDVHPAFLKKVPLCLWHLVPVFVGPKVN